MALISYKNTFVESMVNFAIGNFESKGVVIPDGTREELNNFYSTLVDQIILLVRAGDVTVSTTGAILNPTVTGAAPPPGYIVAATLVSPVTNGSGVGKVS